MFTLTIYRIEESKLLTSDPIKAKSSSEAFARAIFALKAIIQDDDKDVILFEKDGDSTKVTEINSDSVIVKICPNILREGVDKIGPYCLSQKMMIPDNLPEA